MRLASHFGRIADAVAKSLEGSLSRLRLDRVDIFHLQNAITETGGGETLSVRQVLDDVVSAFERLRQQGKTRFLGLTLLQDGQGQPLATLLPTLNSNRVKPVKWLPGRARFGTKPLPNRSVIPRIR